MASKIRDVVQQIKDQADIVDVIGRYVQLSPKGGKFWGLSPFKTEKTPSFCVTPERNFYYCFSTSQGGDVFKFIQEVEHVDFIGAVRILARDLGIDIDDTSYSTHTNSNTKNALEIADRIHKSFIYFLSQAEGKSAWEYMKARGFSDEILTQFKIGYTPNNKDWLYNFLREKGYSDDQIKESGLFSKNYDKLPLFRGRIMFPIMTVSGKVIAYGGRILQGEGPKYINSSVNTISLFNG